MRWILVTLGVGGMALCLTAADSRKRPPNATNLFGIHGMHCEGCAGGIRSELRRLNGVVDAQVSFSNPTAIIRFDTNTVSSNALVKVIQQSGYDITTSPK